jgi:hypothetical protein
MATQETPSLGQRRAKTTKERKKVDHDGFLTLPYILINTDSSWRRLPTIRKRSLAERTHVQEL